MKGRHGKGSKGPRGSHRGGRSDDVPRGPSQRQLRVAEEIRHRLSEIMIRGEVRQPELEGNLVTISEVRISPDLKNATAFIMPLGGQNMESVLAALKRAAPWLRGEVARSAQLRYAPMLSFKPDESFDEAQRIDALLRQPKVAADIGREIIHIPTRDRTRPRPK